MDICQRLGWTLEQWLSLSEWERTDWLAYRLYQRRRITALIDGMTSPHKDKDGNLIHDQNGKPMELVKDFGAYITLLRELI